MKILQVPPYYYPALGGVESHVQAISEALVRLGHEVVVATMQHDCPCPPISVINGVTVLRFFGIGPAAYRCSLGLLNFLRREGAHYDVVHAHNFGDLSLIQTVVTCQGRTVITPHYHGHGNSPLARVLHRFYDPIASRLLRCVGDTVCVSAAEARATARCLHVDPANIKVIPNIIPLPASLSATEKGQASETLGSRCVVLCAGRLAAYKRIDRAITALPYLPENYSLVIIGTGPERAKLEALAERLHLGARVQFLGFVSDDHLHDWLRCAKVVVSFSTGEAFGRIIVEALAYDCGVICSEIPAFQEFAAAFPQKVLTVSDQAGALEVAQTLQRLAACSADEPANLQRYTAAAIIPDLLKVYAAVAESNKPSTTAPGIEN